MSETTQSITEIQDEIVDDFSLFSEWEDRYRYVIELGTKLKPIPAEYKREEFRVRGCQAQVWLYPIKSGDLLTFAAESDAPLVQGLLYLLLKVYSGHRPAEILAAEPTFIEQAGLAENLSPFRVNGMRATVQQIKKYAAAYNESNA
jgi:cysteine desulfuration protein SufE